MAGLVPTNKNNDRSVAASVIIGGARYEQEIQKFTITQSVAKDRLLTLGSTTASMLELTLIGVPGSILTRFSKKTHISVAIGIGYYDSSGEIKNISSETFGTFYLDTIKSKRGNGSEDRYIVEIVAYDAMGLVIDNDGTFGYDNSFDPSEFPSQVSLGGVLSALSGQLPVNFSRTGWNTDLIVDLNRLPQGATRLDVLSYLASASGGCCIAEGGALACKWIDNVNYIIDDDEIYIDGFEYDISENTNSYGELSTPVNVSQLICRNGTENPLYSAFVGRGQDTITFTNPLLRNQEYFDELAEKVCKECAYTPLSVKHRGTINQINLLSRVKVTTAEGGAVNGVITERKIEFDGSLVETDYCYGLNDNDDTLSLDKDDSGGGGSSGGGGGGGSSGGGYGYFPVDIFPVKEDGSLPDNVAKVKPFTVEMNEDLPFPNAVLIVLNFDYLTNGLKYRIPLPNVKVDWEVCDVWELPRVFSDYSGAGENTLVDRNNASMGVGDYYEAKLISHDFSDEGLDCTGAFLEISTEELFKGRAIFIIGTDMYSDIDGLHFAIKSLDNYVSEYNSYPYHPQIEMEKRDDEENGDS